MEGAPDLHWPFLSLLLDPIPVAHQEESQNVAERAIQQDLAILPLNPIDYPPVDSWIGCLKFHCGWHDRRNFLNFPVLGVGMRWSPMSEHGTQQHLATDATGVPFNMTSFQQVPKQGGNHFSKMAGVVFFKNVFAEFNSYRSNGVLLGQ